MVHATTPARYQAIPPVRDCAPRAARLRATPGKPRTLAAVETTESRSLLSTMAHEIRGPLSAVALSSELLLEDLDTMRPDQMRSLAQRIHRGALWMQGLIENVLCDAAIRDDRFELNLDWLDMTEVVREVQDLLEPLLAVRSQELRLVFDTSLPMIRADRRRLGQVLMNLLLNASKFSPAGSPVIVSLGASDAAVRVEVLDRGCGLDGEATALFEPYFRAEHARQAGVIGTGLGLAIVKAIVDAHGGSVGADNRHHGGARFWFEIPAVAA
ncbi:MAG: sensor histidine kinase [Chloroflexota bacterium]